MSTVPPMPVVPTVVLTPLAPAAPPAPPADACEVAVIMMPFFLGAIDDDEVDDDHEEGAQSTGQGSHKRFPPT
jgi:hypothetical protein